MLILNGHNIERKSSNIWFYSSICSFLIVVLIIGCTHFGAKRAQLDTQVQQIKQTQVETAAVYVKGADEALKSIATQDRMPETDLASQLTGLAVDNLPPVPVYLKLDISALLSENQKTRDLAEKSLNKMILQDKVTAQKLDNVEKQLGKVEERLIGLGKIKEKERNSSIIKRIWFFSISSFGILGTIALIIFVPAVLPLLISIFTSLIGAITSMMPSLINFFGVVSKKAYQVTVSGIAKVREEFKKNPDKVYTGKEVQSIVDTTLNKEQDKYPHAKVVVEATRKKLELK